METTANWPELVRHPAAGDHIAQVYRDDAFLVEAVAEYVGQGLRQGDAALIIASPAHADAFMRRLETAGTASRAALERGQLRLLGAEETLAGFAPDGQPDWGQFQAQIGGLIAELRLQYPAVRAYGEVVDVLWQRSRSRRC